MDFDAITLKMIPLAKKSVCFTHVPLTLRKMHKNEKHKNGKKLSEKNQIGILTDLDALTILAFQILKLEVIISHFQHVPVIL